MKHQQCANCIFSSWYHNFEAITFKSVSIKLPLEFVEYLRSDGIVLPDREEVRYSNELDGYSDDEVEWDEEATEDTSKFPFLKSEVERAIEDLGGSVFPKLNWSSPKDAGWISHNGTLKCSTFNEICLLLKSSDFVCHDLNNAYELCEDSVNYAPPHHFELVLREWCEITCGMEFRCFVKQHKLIRISQRHHTSFFDYLLHKKSPIFNGILNFFNSRIKDRFADADFVFDIYIDSDVYYLVDFNPFGPITDSLLFSWDELLELDPQSIDMNDERIFAIVTENSGIQPSQYMSYAMPKDIVDLSHGEDINKMIDLLNLRSLISKPGDSEEEVD